MQHVRVCGKASELFRDAQSLMCRVILWHQVLMEPQKIYWGCSRGWVPAECLCRNVIRHGGGSIHGVLHLHRNEKIAVFSFYAGLTIYSTSQVAKTVRLGTVTVTHHFQWGSDKYNKGTTFWSQSMGASSGAAQSCPVMVWLNVHSAGIQVYIGVGVEGCKSGEGSWRGVGDDWKRLSACIPWQAKSLTLVEDNMWWLQISQPSSSLPTWNTFISP